MPRKQAMCTGLTATWSARSMYLGGSGSHEEWHVSTPACYLSHGSACEARRCLLWTWFTRKCLPKHAFGGSSGFILGDLNADCRYIATHRKRHAKKCHAQNATVYALTFMQVFEWMLLPRSWNSTASLCIVVNRFLRGHHHNSQLLCLWPVYYRYVLKLTTICSL